MSTPLRPINDFSVYTTSYNPTLPSHQSFSHPTIQPYSRSPISISPEFPSNPTWVRVRTDKDGISSHLNDTVRTSNTGGQTIIMPQPVHPSLNGYLAPPGTDALLGNSSQMSSHPPGLSANIMSSDVQRNEALNHNNMAASAAECSTLASANLKGHTIPTEHVPTVDIQDDGWEIIHPDPIRIKVGEEAPNYDCRTIHPNGVDAKPAGGRDVHGPQYDDTVISNGPESSAPDTVVDNSKYSKDESETISSLQDEINKLEEQKESLRRCFYGMKKQSQEWESKFNKEKLISKYSRQYENESRHKLMESNSKLQSSNELFVRALETKDQEIATQTSTIKKFGEYIERIENVNNALEDSIKALEQESRKETARRRVLSRKVEDLSLLLRTRDEDALLDNLRIETLRSEISKTSANRIHQGGRNEVGA